MPKKVKELASKRTQIIQTLLDKLESRVQAAQKNLLKTVLEDFVDGLEADEAGNIKNTAANKRRFAIFDNVFNRFSSTKGLEVVQGITEGVSRLVDFNQQYFSAWADPVILAPIQTQVKETLSAWLGISQRGKVQPNGYLDTLVKSDQVRNGIKNLVLKTVISQGGYNELKKTLQNHIEGNKEQTGALQKYFRNFAYDTFSVVDRTAGKITADKLKFNYAIYEGGLIETSRDFCEEHNGKVYSRDEIAKFKLTEAIPPNYDPFTDMGGYGCRHHWNWIPDVVAFALRPDLKDQAAAKQDPPKEIEPPKKEEQPKPPEGKKLNPAQPFEDIPEYKAAEFVPDTPPLKKAFKEFADFHKNDKAKEKEIDDILKGIDAMAKAKNKIPWEELDTHKEMSAKIYAEYGKISAINEERAKLRGAVDNANSLMKAHLLSGKDLSPVKIDIESHTFKKNKDFKNRIEFAEKFFRVAAKGYIDERAIIVRSGGKGRAYMAGGNVYLNSDTSAQVMVHEFGHVLEYNNHVFKAAVDFLDRRTAGKPVKSLRSLTGNRGYRANEMAKDGGFYNPYIGKIYAGTKYNGKAYTEVISMGLDRMYKDPLGFYNEDREHFNLIYSLFFKR